MAEDFTELTNQGVVVDLKLRECLAPCCGYLQIRYHPPIYRPAGIAQCVNQDLDHIVNTLGNWHRSQSSLPLVHSGECLWVGGPRCYR